MHLSPGQLKGFLAACLILTPLQQSAVSLAAGSPRHTKANKAATSLTPEERATHALNRLTFGPRPGDVETVEAMGVDRWIEMQLHPERIDDSSLNLRLQDYPALQLSQRDLIRDFPSPAAIRAVADGKLSLPRDRVERAIYENGVFAYQERKQKQAEDAANKPSAATMTEQPNSQEMHPGPDSSANAAKENLPADRMALEDVASSPSMTMHEQKLYSDLASTQVVNLPPDQRLNRLETMRPEEFSAFVKGLTKEERARLIDGMTPRQKEIVLALVNPTLVVAGELTQRRLLIDIYSQRQLQAVMTDFWLNHFNVFLRKGPFAPWYLADYQQKVIEPRAMGKFEDLLVATAKSPAMLFYLDNHTSIGPASWAAMRAQFNPMAKRRDLGLNENYARELMELHTLGVDGGYTQRDVTEVAKVFTGWTIDAPRQGGAFGFRGGFGFPEGFVFNERRHQPGPKYVLGKIIRENGEREGLEVLHMLATSPSTARHLSRELAVRFVSDDPPASLVDRMTQTYLDTGGDIREVLRTMFTSREFWSPESYRAKVKTPEEFVISAVRATDGDVQRPAALLGAMDELGMPFFGCQTPNGYSWTASAWVNTGDLLNRMNIALALAGHKLGTVADMDALLKISAPDALPIAEKEMKLEEGLLNGQMNQQARDAVLKQVDQMTGRQQAALAQPSSRPTLPQGFPKRAALVQMSAATPIPAPGDLQAAIVAGLLLGSPNFQRR